MSKIDLANLEEGQRILLETLAYHVSRTAMDLGTLGFKAAGLVVELQLVDALDGLRRLIDLTREVDQFASDLKQIIEEIEEEYGTNG